MLRHVVMAEESDEFCIGYLAARQLSLVKDRPAHDSVSLPRTTRLPGLPGRRRLLEGGLAASLPVASINQTG